MITLGLVPMNFAVTVEWINGSESAAVKTVLVSMTRRERGLYWGLRKYLENSDGVLH